MSVRLQKYLADAGLASRRACEEFIRAGRVTVDGEVAQLGCSVDPGLQRVLVDGRPVTPEEAEYWLLNKPPGVLSAAVDTRGRRTVVECVPARGRVYPVGRLDLDTSGLLLLTNDGDLAARLLHPRYHVDKEYLVTVRGIVEAGSVEALRRGLELEDGLTAPAMVCVISTDSARAGGSTTLKVTIHEGRKRQIRRMFAAIGHRVLRLHRSGFAGLSDRDLAVGEARRLSAHEVERLQRAAGPR